MDEDDVKREENRRISREDEFIAALIYLIIIGIAILTALYPAASPLGVIGWIFAIYLFL